MLPALSKFYRLALLLAASAFVTATPAVAASSIELVLDASGSMNAALPEGGTRFEAARASVLGLLEHLPPATTVALRVYGHQSSPDQKNCQDTELVAPFGAVAEQIDAIRGKVGGLSAQGYTPISLSLQRAAEDLAGTAPEGRVVILVSDGKETCNADPCAVAKALADADAALVVHTIGFGVNSAARGQLQCIARVARGSYFDAGSAADLALRLGQAVRAPAVVPVEPPTPKTAVGVLRVDGIEEPGRGVVDSATGEIVQSVGSVGGGSVELPPGIYGVAFVNGLWTGIDIVAGETTTIVPAYLNIENPANTNLSLVDPETQTEVAAIHQQSAPLVGLVPGAYRVVTMEGFELGTAEFEAGTTVVVRPGILRIVAGQDYHGYAIRSAATGQAGTLTVLKGQDVSLPADRYVISDPDDATVPPVEVTVEAGGVHEVTVGG